MYNDFKELTKLFQTVSKVFKCLLDSIEVIVDENSEELEASGDKILFGSSTFFKLSIAEMKK